MQRIETKKSENEASFRRKACNQVEVPLLTKLCLEAVVQPNTSAIEKAKGIWMTCGSWLLGLVAVELILLVEGSAYAFRVPSPEKVV